MLSIGSYEIDISTRQGRKFRRMNFFGGGGGSSVEGVGLYFLALFKKNDQK